MFKLFVRRIHTAFLNQPSYQWYWQGLRVLVPMIVLLIAGRAQAQVSYQGSIRTLPVGTTPLSNPKQVAVDQSGNRYIVDATTNRVVKISPRGVVSVIGMGSFTLNGPSGVAVDAQGNVFVADTQNDRVLVALNGGVVQQVGTGAYAVSRPHELAVDRAGTLYIASTGNSAVIQVKFTGGYIQAGNNVAGTSEVTGIISGAAGVAVDRSGSLYVADTGNNQVLYWQAPVVLAGAETTLPGLSGISQPISVAVDNNGNLYIVQQNEILQDVKPLSTAIVSLLPLTGFLVQPQSVNADDHGNLYVSDTQYSLVSPAGPAAMEISLQSVNLEETTIGVTSPTQTLYFSVPYGVTLGSVNLVQQGVNGSPVSFHLVPNVAPGSRPCIAGITNTSCAVSVSFTPTVPQLAQGALTLVDDAGNVVNTALLQGLGSGPQAVYSPGTPVAVNLGSLAATVYPTAAIADPAGNIFVADQIHRVLKVAAAGGSVSAVNTGSISLQTAYDVALDGAGNLYIADRDGDQLVKVTPSGVASALLSGTHLNPVALATDGDGNLYVAGGGGALRITPAGTTASLLPSGTLGTSGASGIAIDSNGNVYVSDPSTPQLLKVLPNGQYSGLPIPPTATPFGLAIDGAGTLYIGNQQNPPLEMTPSGDFLSLPTGVIALQDNLGVSVDSTGSLLIADNVLRKVYRFDRNRIPAESFGSTAVGLTSSDSPQTQAVQNAGDQPLIFSALSYPVDFPANAADAIPCTASIALDEGQTCDLSVNFTPTVSGALNESVSFASNSLNQASTAGGLQLSGTAVSRTLTFTPASVSFAGTNAGSTATAQTITVTNTGSASVTLGTASLMGTNAAAFALSADTCSGSTLAASGACTLSITFTPATAGSFNASLVFADNAVGNPQTVPLTGTGLALTKLLTVSPASVTFSPTETGSQSTAQYITLTNAGTDVVNFSGAVVNGANAAVFQFSSGTCTGSSLAPGASCALSMVFAPVATGPQIALLLFGTDAGSTTIDLSGTGVLPTVTLSPGSLDLTAVTGTTSTQNITLTNTSTVTLTLGAISFSGAGAAAFSQVNNCGVTMAAGANCSITVAFNPTTTDTKLATLSIANNAANSPQLVSLVGTGAAPGAFLTDAPSQLTFPSTAVGATAATQTVTIQNTGTAVLTISSITLTGTNAASFAKTSTCGATLGVGGSCTIAASFTPVATGAQAAGIVVADSAPDSPQTIGLTGTATAATAAAITLSPTTLTFAGTGVGTSATAQTVTLTNSGTASLALGGISIAGANAGSFTQNNNCPGTVAVNASCTISIIFVPQTEGALTASVSIADTLSGSPQTVLLNGSGTSQTTQTPAVNLSPGSLSFAAADIGSASAAKTVVLTNTGTAALSLTSIALSGADAGSFAQTNNCGSTVAAGANCAIAITFTPQAAGNLAALASISDNAPGVTQEIVVTGLGNTPAVTAPAVNLTPGSLSFAATQEGSAATAQTVTLTNTGTATLNLASIALTGPDSGSFNQTNTCGNSVAAGSSCTLSIGFTPTAEGHLSATLTIADDAAGSLQQVLLAGVGNAVPLAGFSLSLSAGSSSVAAGSPATANLTLASQNGFSGSVMLGCAGLPDTITCTFLPAAVTLGAGSASTATAVITINSNVDDNVANASLETVHGGHRLPPLALPGSGLGLALILLPAIRRWRFLRWIGLSVCLLATLGAGIAMTGCGGDNSTRHIPITPSGSYSLSITATNGTVTQQAQYILTVK